MKNISRLLVIALLLLSPTLHAQGWKWGTGSKCAYGFLNAGHLVVDKNSNTYATGILVPNTATVPWDLLVCTFDNDTVRGGGMIITSTDSNGAFRWALRSNHGQIFDIAIDSASNIYVFGYTSGNVVLGNDSLVTNYVSSNAFCAKISSAGVPKWIKKIADTAFGFNGGVDRAGNVYVAGQFKAAAITIGTTTLTNSGAMGSYDIFLAKLDSNGNNIWARKLGTDSTDNLASIVVSDSGYIYMAGDYKAANFTIGTTTLPALAAGATSNLFLAKYDAAGNALWASSIIPEGVKFLNDISLDAWENLYLTGGYTNNIIFQNDSLPVNNTPIVHMYLAKYNKNGMAQWATSVDNPKYVQAWSVAPDVYGNVLVDGAASGVSGRPLYIITFDSAGHFIDSTFLDQGGLDQSSLAVDNMKNVYVCSDYEDTFHVGPDALSLETGAMGALLIAKYGYKGSTLSAGHIMRPAADIKIYPNPTTGTLLNIDADNSEYTSFTITNTLGQVITIQHINTAHTQTDVSAMPTGIYYISFTGAHATQVRKWVKI